jgi:hypothetical protein
MPKNGLKVVNDNNVVANTTCYATHAKYEVACMRRRCPNWLNLKNSQNCTLIAASQGAHTLERIGEIYSVSRMQICKIEKQIKDKILKAS